MRGEQGPFDSGVQLTEKHPLISFVIKSKLRRPREEVAGRRGGLKTVKPSKSLDQLFKCAQQFKGTPGLEHRSTQVHLQVNVKITRDLS